MIEIILGPPGTGKTTTLLEIVEDTLQSGVPPDRIAYISFTRRAAEEAIERACKKFQRDQKEFPYFRTIHSLCYRMLGLRSSDILTGKKFSDFADWCGIRVTGRAWSDDGMLSAFEIGDRILFMENLSRIRCVTLRQQYERNEVTDLAMERDVIRVDLALAEIWRRCYMVCSITPTCLSDAHARAERRPALGPSGRRSIPQDLSLLQWNIVWKLMEKAKRTVIAGDDDQAIYRWAGADVETLINMKGKVRVLGQSWRCPRLIQKVSNRICLRNVSTDRNWQGMEVLRCELIGDASTTKARSAMSKVGGTSAHARAGARNAYILARCQSRAVSQDGWHRLMKTPAGKSSLKLWTRCRRPKVRCALSASGKKTFPAK